MEGAVKVDTTNNNTIMNIETPLATNTQPSHDAMSRIKTTPAPVSRTMDCASLHPCHLHE